MIELWLLNTSKETLYTVTSNILSVFCRIVCVFLPPVTSSVPSISTQSPFFAYYFLDLGIYSAEVSVLSEDCIVPLCLLLQPLFYCCTIWMTDWGLEQSACCALSNDLSYQWLSAFCVAVHGSGMAFGFSIPTGMPSWMICWPPIQLKLWNTCFTRYNWSILRSIFWKYGGIYCRTDSEDKI